MIVRTIVPTVGDSGPMPIGTTIEHPDAWILADQHLAIAVDEEAKQACGDWRKKHARKAKPLPIVTLPSAQSPASAAPKPSEAPAKP